jgi:hypothetical protein
LPRLSAKSNRPPFSGALAENGVAFGLIQDSPPAWRQSTQAVSTDTNTDEPQRRMPYRGGHPSDLPVLALG